MKLPRRSKRIATVAALLLGTVLVTLVMLGLLLFDWLAAAPHEWSRAVRVGPLRQTVSVQRLLQVATDPRVLWLLEGKAVQTAWGTWRVRALPHGAADIVCRPCVLHAPALGAANLRIASATLELRHRSPDVYAGKLTLGDDATAPTIPWIARLDAAGVTIDAEGEALGLEGLFALLQADAPEFRQARVSGTLSFRLQLRLPERSWQFEPRIDNFAVAGLGTERLLNVALPARCMADGQARVRGWLPAAVIAAEDQHFAAHPGYDLEGILAAAHGNTRDGATLYGASTITQQLAKLLFTGDDRSAVRKLRELLYAVEMERTLGKARILQMYLALAPWGDGLCGAAHAAQCYLGKPVSQLTPLEAAWLASLLKNPQRALQVQRRRGAVDAPYVARIIEGMRPMARWRREQALMKVTALRPDSQMSTGGLCRYSAVRRLLVMSR